MTKQLTETVNIRPVIGKGHYTGDTQFSLNDLIKVVEEDSTRPYKVTAKSRFYMGHGRFIYRVIGRRLDNEPVVETDSEEDTKRVFSALYKIKGYLKKNTEFNYGITD